jgi:glycosyltransferase involved in cell wall biosynthesis
VYGEIDMNLIDGSSVWLQSIALVLSRIESTRVTVVLRVPEKRGLLLDPLRAAGCAVVDPGSRRAGVRRLDPADAAVLLEEVDAEDRFNLLLLRGSAVADAVVERGAFDGRLWPYYVPVHGSGAEADQAALRRRVGAAHRVLCQTDAIRARVAQAAPAAAGKLVLLPPMIPPAEQDPPAGVEPDAPLRRLFYAGKFSPEYYFLEMLELLRRVRDARPDIELHVAGDKVHNPPDDPDFKPAAEAALRSTPGLVWHGALPREEVRVLAQQADVALSIRHPGMDSSTELSTKILEYGAAGCGVVLNRNPVHVGLLGEDYPLLVNGIDEAVARVLQIADDPNLRHAAMARCHQASLGFTFDRIAESLAPHVRAAAPVELAPRAVPEAARRNVVIAGHALGFFREISERLTATGATVREDVWKSHTVHDEEASRAALEWADVVVCEWCLGNAVWYSRHKRPGQRLVVRMHRQEIETDHATEVDLDAIDAMIFVAGHIRDAACARFGWNPEDPRFHVVPNAIDMEGLHRPKLRGAEFTLSMVGWVNHRKRLDRALDILERVRAQDERFRLVLKGKAPWDFAWMRQRDEERGFYDAMFRRIRHSSLLGPAVTFEGFGDMALFFQTTGYILSLSDSEGHPVAVAEGMASGATPVIFDRPGAHEQYPAEWVHAATEAAAISILNTTRGEGPIATGERARAYAQQWTWDEVRHLWGRILLGAEVPLAGA